MKQFSTIEKPEPEKQLEQGKEPEVPDHYLKPVIERIMKRSLSISGIGRKRNDNHISGTTSK
jgi:hypothetical protein